MRLTSDSDLNDASGALRVKALAVEPQPFWAYNLEVADYHTFFVGAGRAWVHNVPCGPILKQLGQTGARPWREAARNVWEKLTGVRARASNLDVHHRIPLEWAHLFPKANPNRRANLIGLPGPGHSSTLPGIVDPSKIKTVHDVVSEEWEIFRKFYEKLNRSPTPAEVVKKAVEVDEKYSKYYYYP